MYILLAIYTLFLIIIWGFFIVAKIHACKFKDFSDKIEKYTNILVIMLIVLSIAGYSVIFYMYSWSKSKQINFIESDLYFNEVNY